MVASLAREELCQAGEGLFNPISRHRQVYIDFQVFIYWICAPYRFFGSFIGELKYGKRQARLETRSAEDPQMALGHIPDGGYFSCDY